MWAVIVNDGDGGGYGDLGKNGRLSRHRIMNSAGWLRGRGQISAAVMISTAVVFGMEMFSNWAPGRRVGVILLLSIIPVALWLLTVFDGKMFSSRIVSWAVFAVLAAAELYLFEILVYQS